MAGRVVQDLDEHEYEQQPVEQLEDLVDERAVLEMSEEAVDHVDEQGRPSEGKGVDDVPTSGGEMTSGSGDPIPVQLASRRGVRVVAGTLVGSDWRSRAMDVSDK